MYKIDGSTLTARREDLDLAPIYGYALPEPRRGVWVVREADGKFVEWSRYRNDLLDQFPGLTIIGD
jgi:hypothetical protein